MSCEICGRGACQRSFHSFEAQERYDKAKEFDGNIRAIADALDSRDSEISELKAENTHLRERVEKLEAEAGECAWKEDYDGNWETSCNEIFIIMEGSPEENSMRYCTYCGKKLVTVRAALRED